MVENTDPLWIDTDRKSPEHPFLSTFVDEWDWADEQLPDPINTQELRVLALTWNMKGQGPPDDITDMLRGNVHHHIYAVTAQECMKSIASSMIFASMEVWEEKVQSTLGRDYFLIESYSLGGTHLAVFAHETLRPYINKVEKDRVISGFGNIIANKGGIGISFSVGETSILVVGCHLSSGQKAEHKRNKDFIRIDKELNLPKGSEPGRVTLKTDACVFMGDMNSRISEKREIVDTLLEHMVLGPLRGVDQLNNFKNQSNAMEGLSEGDLDFPPTYRFNLGENIYDTSKQQRIPSWTDRVFYRGMTLKKYSAIVSNCYSDHKPVYAQFLCQFKLRANTEVAVKGRSKACCIY